jgi:hypothetical protein
VLAAIRHV